MVMIEMEDVDGVDGKDVLIWTNLQDQNCNLGHNNNLYWFLSMLLKNFVFDSKVSLTIWLSSTNPTGRFNVGDGLCVSRWLVSSRWWRWPSLPLIMSLHAKNTLLRAISSSTSLCLIDWCTKFSARSSTLCIAQEPNSRPYATYLYVDKRQNSWVCVSLRKLSNEWPDTKEWHMSSTCQIVLNL